MIIGIIGAVVIGSVIMALALCKAAARADEMAEWQYWNEHTKENTDDESKPNKEDNNQEDNDKAQR